MSERDKIAAIGRRLRVLEEMHTPRWPSGECAPEDHEWGPGGLCLKCPVRKREFLRRKRIRWRAHP